MDLESDITSIVSQIAGIPAGELNPNASFVSDLGFDSLRALEILAAIESKYAITIDPERLKEMITLNDVIRVTRDYVPMPQGAASATAAE